jgi:type I site-specific restriction-modification system R (restriction) subunit
MIKIMSTITIDNIPEAVVRKINATPEDQERVRTLLIQHFSPMPDNNHKTASLMEFLNERIAARDAVDPEEWAKETKAWHDSVEESRNSWDTETPVSVLDNHGQVAA